MLSSFLGRSLTFVPKGNIIQLKGIPKNIIKACLFVYLFTAKILFILIQNVDGAIICFSSFQNMDRGMFMLSHYQSRFHFFVNLYSLLFT